MAQKIKILIVEDEGPKAAHIDRYLGSLGLDIVVSFAKSVNGALDEIDAEVPDLLLLDMSLPTFDVGDREDGGRPQGFGGVEVLRTLSFEGVSCPTIVITGYEAFPRDANKRVELSELRKELDAEFGNIVGLLHYNSTYDQWKIELSEALNRFSGNE